MVYVHEHEFNDVRSAQDLARFLQLLSGRVAADEDTECKECISSYLEAMGALIDGNLSKSKSTGEACVFDQLQWSTFALLLVGATIYE
ncbi:hypothetical protein PHYC_02578 [Phycisphaerales bacterium]|nr:hypothetical protein PHYC_02578 [Phycisphaerales bacterium]